MKNVFKYILLLAAVFSFAACQKHSFREVYPEETPEMSAGLSAENVTYGSDSLVVNVGITAKQTPLSTLTVKVVAGTVVLASDVFRTKDFEYHGQYTYAIPFKKGMEDGAEVRVVLSAENIEGVKNQQVLTAKGHSPKFETMYAMPPSPTESLIGKGMEMKKDGDGFILTDLNWPKKFEFFFATVGTKFGRVDWTKPVFGMVDGELTLVTEAMYKAGEAQPISINDEVHSAVDTIWFNPSTVTWAYSGPEVHPATKIDVNTDLEEEPASISSGSVRKLYRGAKILLEQDSEIEIAGIADLENGLDYDFFEYAGGNKAKFLGKTDMYYVYYRVEDDFLVVEHDYTAAYPDVMWVCGVGMAQPTTTVIANETTTTGWGFDSPDQNFCCRTIADGVYQFTAYMHNVDGEDEKHPGFGTVNFKFFHQHGWGGEEAGNNYAMSGDVNIIGSEEESNVGNWWASSEPFSGIIRVTLDTKNMTCTYKKIK